MGRRLAGYVPVHDGDSVTWYGPDDDIPAEVAANIGDHAWVDDGLGDEPSEPNAPKPSRRSGKAGQRAE